MIAAVDFGWRISLAKAIGFPGNTFNSMSNGEIVGKLFEGCFSPGIELATDATTIDIPDDFNIRVNTFLHYIFNLLFL